MVPLILFNEVLGTDVNVPEKPLRIVCLSPAITEILFMLGLGDRVIGVSAFCARPPEARNRRKFGSYNTVNIKALADVKPDLILAITGYQRELAVKLSKIFPIYPLELPVSVAGIVDLVLKTGLVTGEHAKARVVASSLIRNLDSLNSLVKNDPRVYVEIDLGGPVSFGAFSYITDAISLIGAHNVFGEKRAEWISVDLDSIQREKLDVFIYEAKMYSDFDESMLQKLLVKRQWNSLDFVKRGNYFLAPHRPLDFLAHHGPSFITEAMPWLAEKLRNVNM